MPRRRKDSGDVTGSEPMFTSTVTRYSAPDPDKAAEVVTAIINETGLSLRQLEKKTGVNYSTINNMKQGGRASWENVFWFAVRMGQNVNELLRLFGHQPIELTPSEWKRLGLIGRNYSLAPADGSEDPEVDSFRALLDRYVQEFPPSVRDELRGKLAAQFEMLFGLAAENLRRSLKAN